VTSPKSKGRKNKTKVTDRSIDHHDACEKENDGMNEKREIVTPKKKEKTTPRARACVLPYIHIPQTKGDIKG
jgi:hypothetical protein